MICRLMAGGQRGTLFKGEFCGTDLWDTGTFEMGIDLSSKIKEQRGEKLFFYLPWPDHWQGVHIVGLVQGVQAELLGKDRDDLRGDEPLHLLRGVGEVFDLPRVPVTQH